MKFLKINMNKINSINIRNNLIQSLDLNSPKKIRLIINILKKISKTYKKKFKKK